ncbi:MAG: tetratricopeptide repeat protein, partial [Candidatus Obscuribacterales bacterium]|nr:tetratricopeptide repeat protein [Candidatus Obscuribacterales bacterium]
MKRPDQLTFGKKLALAGASIVVFNLIALLVLWCFLDADSYVEKFREAYSFIEHPGEGWEDGYKRRAEEATRRIEKNPRDSRAYAKRGEANYWLQMYDQALRDFDQAIKLGGAKAEWYNRRGYLYDQLDKHDLAFRDFSRAIEIEPSNGDFYESRAEHLSDLEKYDQALLDFERALKHSNARGKIWLRRAAVYRAMHRSEAAIEDLDKAIASNESYYSAEAMEARAEIHSENKQYEKALKDYRLWIETAPESSEPLEKRADLLQELGRVDDAREDLQAAVVLIGQSLNDDSYAYQFDERGDLYKRLGEIDKARADWRKSLELYQCEKVESYTFSAMSE